MKNNNTMKNTRMMVTAVVVAVVGFSAAVQATPICYDFMENGQNQNLGTSDTFTEGGIAITAYGYKGDNPIIQGGLLSGASPTKLYSKYTSGNPAETGLGLKYNVDHEISYNQAVALDLSNLGGLLNGATLGLGSLQTGENALVYGSLDGINWSLLDTLAQSGSTAMNSYSLTGAYSWIAVTETGNGGDHNVLITSLCTSQGVPDGGATVMMLGMALTGLGLLSRKLRQV